MSRGGTTFCWGAVVQPVLYVSLIVLWFKDNFSALRKVQIDHVFAGVPLAALILYPLFSKVRQKRLRVRLRLSREIAVLLGLLLLTVAFRIPYLTHSYGAMNSDDAVMGLMGKHISEGKVPPICFYGVRYLGSLSSHVYAFFFTLFGYSTFVLKASALFIYLAFMTVNFFFLKDVFSFPYSVLVTLFLSLPFPELVRAGLDNTAGFALVLLFGSSLAYLSYLVSFKAQKERVPLLGFLMGVAFWAHPITAGYILAALLVLLLKAKLPARNYAPLAFSAVLGFLPQLMLEVSQRLNIVRFLLAEGGRPDWGRLRNAARLTGSLLSAAGHPLRNVLLTLVLLGAAYLVFMSVRNKSFSPPALFSLVFLCVALPFVLSRFGSRPNAQYLYPLYACLPVLLIAPSLALKSTRARFLIPLAGILTVFFFFNWEGSRSRVRLVKDRHVRLARLVRAMEGTGQRYWYSEYWGAYLLTSISKERLIVDAYSINRYPPYSLAYWNRNEEDNYVFFRHYDVGQQRCYANLKRWLKTLAIPAKRMDVGKMHLVYAIKDRLPPWALWTDPPRQLPRIELQEASPGNGFLHLVFRNQPSGEKAAFHLRAEISGYCCRRKPFSPADQEIRLELPLPRDDTFSVKYWLDHSGLEIPATVQRISLSLPAGEPRARDDKVVFLRGFGPRVRFRGQKRTILERSACLEFEKNPGKETKVRFYIHVPFGFSDWRWYGNFVQRLRVELNHAPFLDKELRDGDNIVELEIPNDRSPGETMMMTLNFRYHGWLPSFPQWKTAAFLDRIVFPPQRRRAE